MRFFTEKIGIPYPYTKYARIAVADFISVEWETPATHQSPRRYTTSVRRSTPAVRDWWPMNLPTNGGEPRHFRRLVACLAPQGFATYFEALYRRKARGEDEFAMSCTKMLRAISIRTSAGIEDRCFRALHPPVDLFDSHMYNKGSLVLEILPFDAGGGRLLQSTERTATSSLSRV